MRNTNRLLTLAALLAALFAPSAFGAITTTVSVAPAASLSNVDVTITLSNTSETTPTTHFDLLINSGNYSISGNFSGHDFVGPTTTDVHVLVDGTSRFNNGPVES